MQLVAARAIHGHVYTSQLVPCSRTGRDKVPAPAKLRGFSARLDPSRGLRAAVASFSPRPRRALRAALAEFRGSRRPASVEPQVSEEKAALHLCGVRLPMDRAQRELGYNPVVDFATASRHAISWLAFAGYPVGASPMADTDPIIENSLNAQQARSLTE